MSLPSVLHGVTCSKSIIFIIVTFRTSQILHSISYFLSVGNEILRLKTKTDIFMSHFRQDIGAHVFWTKQ